MLFNQFTGRVYVHCDTGITLSASLVLAYLMIDWDLRAKDAISLVHSRRDIIYPTKEQFDGLADLDNKLERLRYSY